MAKRVREDSAASHEGEDDSSEPSRSQSPAPGAHTPKYASLEPASVIQTSTMRCALPPHNPTSFSSYGEYESHYQQVHTNRCTECKKNLPSSHFLDLHIAENHDPIVASKREAGEKTYACFVEDCEKVCSEWKKRRSHLVDKHSYPRNYDFLIVDNGVDGRTSMLRPGIDEQGHRKSSRERRTSSISQETHTTDATSVDKSAITSPKKQQAGLADASPEHEGGVDASKKAASPAVDGLTSSMSALRMIPRTVTFGKRKARSGFAKS